MSRFPHPSARHLLAGLTGGALRARLLGWFLLFSLVPLAASNSLGYLRSRGIIERQIERHVQALADVRATQVQDAVRRQLRELETLAAGNEFLAAGALAASGRRAGAMRDVASGTTLERYLIRKHEGLPSFDALFLLRPEGDVVVHTGRDDPAAMRLPERMPLTYSVVAGRLRVLTAVRDTNGLTVGYLGGLIGTRGLQLMFGVQPHERGSIESYVLDANGRALYATHAHARLGRELALRAPPGRVAHYRDRAGHAVVGTAAAIPELGWHYLAEAPLGVVLAPLTRLRSLSIGFAAGLCVLVAMSAWLVAGGIVAPVKRLVAAAQRVGEGDLTIRLHEPSRDELRELADAFNSMTAQLERASARVRELHRGEIERAGQLATVGELASSVAHEIKNPVVSVTNGLDLVRRRIGNDPMLLPILEEMQRQLTRIDGAVRDLLSYARPAVPSIAAVPARELVERAVRVVQLAAQRADLVLEVDTPADTTVVHVDAELLTQALVNLLLNAVQATPAGGTVRLRVRAEAGTVQIAVEDTGRGILADDLPHIFKPFFTTRHSGTGLGLSITRDVVERHGGRVYVESEPGRGSTFTMVLPELLPALPLVSA